MWLLTRSGVDEVYREQFQVWLEEQFDTNVPYRDFVTSLVTATGKSNENGSVHFVFRHLGDPLMADMKGARVDIEKFGKYDNVPITSRVTRMFLGIQTQCTQCHDHPQAKGWVQNDFWGVNVFFRQTEKVGQQTAMGKKGTGGVTNAVELRDEPSWNKEAMVLRPPERAAEGVVRHDAQGRRAGRGRPAVHQDARDHQRGREQVAAADPGGLGAPARQLREGVRQPDVGPPVRPRAAQGTDR